MFSGLVQEVGALQSKERRVIEVLTRSAQDHVGDSLAINGICLTVARKARFGGKTRLRFELSPETLRRTTLKALTTGAPLNIERALSAKDAWGGHIVQGHVDGVGKVSKIRGRGKSRDMWIKAPAAILKFAVPKGSIAVDGVSLTIVDLKRGEFSVSLIPFTLSHTNLGSRRPGDNVNLEADLLAKYIERYVKRK